MLRGGALGGSYHMHQMGSLSSEPPLSPTTSSSQARTMPFLMTTRCAESSTQLTSGTSCSPFTYNIPGDGFLSPAMDNSKPDNCQAPASTTVSTFFPSSRPQEIILEDLSLSSTQAQATSQQILNRGSSFQSTGTDTNNSQSSGTSEGSSQLSNGGRHCTGVSEKDDFSYNQLHTATSAAIDDRNTVNGADPLNEATEQWGGNQQGSVIMTEEQSMIQQHQAEGGQDGRNEKISQESGAHESGPNHEHQLRNGQVVFHSDQNTSKEEQSKFNQQHNSEHDMVDTAGESVRVYSGENVPQSNVSEIFPAYNTNLMASDSYNFPTGAELLGVPTQLQHSSNHQSRGSVPNGVPDEGVPFGNVGALYPNQNLVGRLGYSTPSLKGSWTNITPQYANSSLIDGNVHSNLQAISPVVGTSVSSLISESLQDNPYSHGEPANRDGTTYFSPQQSTTEAMQLCLNPSFGGPNAESQRSVAPPGNLVLMSHSGVEHLSSSHNQQHFLSIPVPPAALAQSALAQRSQLLTHPGIPSAVPSQHILGNQGYNNNNWRNGGNELLFLPGSDSTVHSQPFTGQLSEHLQQAELGISQFGSRRSSGTLSSVNQLHQNSFFQNGDGQNSSTGMGNSQMQGLSLSLSSQQPSALQLQLPDHGRTHDADIDVFAVMSQASVEAKGKRVECTEGRYNGILSRFRPQRDDHELAMSAAAQRLNNYGQPLEGKHSLLVNPSTDPFVASHAPYGSNASKYLKLCQLLLNEICVVRKCERRTLNNDHLRSQRSSWSTDQPSSASASNTFASFHANRDPVGADSTRKEFNTSMMNMPALPGSSSSIIAESRGREAMFQTHIQSESREDLENKKVRLQSFLEEVDRRYRAYGEHMMDIVNQFNALAGPDAATPYTALALQAMSRHFRCLRDAISAQLRAVKRALGEQDTSPGYAGRDLSSLRFVDQQLRQQRTLQQLGMLQQHAWRPQRGLPERAVSVLRSWLFEHFLHPYPKDSDKLFLAKQTGLTRSQVSNWFINARVRLWKPMVEEMYLEEFSNSDEGGSGEKKTAKERRRENEALEYDDANLGATGFPNGHTETGAEKQQRITISSGDGMYSQSNMRTGHGSAHQNASTSNSVDFDADQRGGILKRARNSMHNSSDHLSSPIVGMEIDTVSPGGPFHDPCRLDGSYNSSADQDYSQHQDILAAANGARFGTYMGGNLPGYPGSNFVSRATASTNGGVSLTLGLRHSDGLSLQGAAPQPKYGNQGHPTSQRSKDHFDSSGVQDHDVVRNMDNVHSELPLSHLDAGQEDLKQRNRLTSHLLHEFVAQGKCVMFISR
ncbi:unnamed protein product [Calypogeia fissa]